MTLQELINHLAALQAEMGGADTTEPTRVRVGSFNHDYNTMERYSAVLTPESIRIEASLGKRILVLGGEE